MGNIEKKIVTTVVWGFAALAGSCMAETVYDTCMSGYMKVFHKDAWNKALKEVSEELTPG